MANDYDYETAVREAAKVTLTTEIWQTPSGNPLPIENYPVEDLHKMSSEQLNLLPMEQLSKIITRLKTEQIRGISSKKIAKLSIKILIEIIKKLSVEQITAIPINKLRAIPKKTWQKVPMIVLSGLPEKIVCELPGGIRRHIKYVLKKSMGNARRTAASDQRQTNRPIDLKKATLTVATVAVAILISLQLYLDQIRPAINANQVAQDIIITLQQDGILSDTGKLTISLEDALAQLPDDPLSVYATLIRPGFVSLDDLAQAKETSVPALIQSFADKMGISDDDPDKYLGDRVFEALEDAYVNRIEHAEGDVQHVVDEFLGHNSDSPGRGH